MDNSNSSITESEMNLMEDARRYAGKPFIEKPEPSTQHVDHSGYKGRTTMINGEAHHENLAADYVGRDTSAGGAGTGFSMSGAMAYDPGSLYVRMGGIEMTQAQARDYIKRGMFQQSDLETALEEAIAPYEGRSFK